MGGLDRFLRKGSSLIYLKIALIVLIVAFAVSAVENTTLGDENLSDDILIDSQEVSNELVAGIKENNENLVTGDVITNNKEDFELFDNESMQTEAVVNEIDDFLMDEDVELLIEENEPQEKEAILPPKEILLATEVNGVSTNDPYIEEYLEQRNNFEDINFITTEDSSTFSLKEGNNVPEDISGYILNDKKYAIHLIICDEEDKACYFRINGVPTGKLVSADSGASKGVISFSLDDEYNLEVKSIIFNYCGDRRFCDIYWDEEDIVELEIRGN